LSVLPLVQGCYTFQVAYTFDAGANACLYLLEEDVPQIISLVYHFFPPKTNGREFFTGLPCEQIELDQVDCFKISEKKLLMTSYNCTKYSLL